MKYKAKSKIRNILYTRHLNCSVNKYLTSVKLMVTVMALGESRFALSITLIEYCET